MTKRHGRKRKSAARTARNKAWRELSARLRTEKGRCEVCGESGALQVHHLLAKKAYPGFMFDEGNLLVLCRRCHFLYHKGREWEFVAWLRENKPDQFEHVMKLAASVR